MKPQILSWLVVIFFGCGLMTSRAEAQTAENAGPLEIVLEDLCKKIPSRDDVERVRNNWQPSCQSYKDVDAVLDSVEKTCEAGAFKKSTATAIPPHVLKDWVQYVKNAGIDLNEFIACGTVVPTIIRLGKEQECIDAYWKARRLAVMQQKQALSEQDDNQFRCLDKIITQYDVDVNAGKFACNQRIEKFSADVKRCATVLSSSFIEGRNQFGLFVGLTVTGAALFMGGTGAIIWGSTAVCSGRDAVGNCLDGDRVNQRRLTGWIAGGAGVLLGSALGIVGISGLIRGKAQTAPQISLIFGPGQVQLQGRF